MQRPGPFISLALSLSIFFCGCDAEVQQKTSAATPAQLPERYEIRDVRNGSLVGSVLLDKQTGQTWIMAHFGTGENQYQAWQPMGYASNDDPCDVPPPLGNGACLQTKPSSGSAR